MKKFLRRFRTNKNSNDKQIKRIANFANNIYPMPTVYAFVENQTPCHQILVSPEYTLNPELIEGLYKAKLNSFQSFNNSTNILLNSTDFDDIIRSHNSYANDLAQITGRSHEQAMYDIAHYHASRKFSIQPSGVSGFIHRLGNGLYLSTAIIQTSLTTATSHLSGVTGMSLIASSPVLVITVPLLGGVFFGGLERIAANTPLQSPLMIARDVCLIIPKVVEISCNELFFGPLLRTMNIDAQLNVTSTLRFGSGTRHIAGSFLNATIDLLKQQMYFNPFK